MAKNIIMLYSKTCLDSMVLMPFLKGLSRGGEYKFEFYEISLDKDGKKIKEKYKKAIKDSGKENAVPMFINVDENEAMHITSAEKFLAWTEGPEWWKK